MYVLLTACIATVTAAPSLHAQFHPAQKAIADFDAEVAAAVAEDAGGAISVAVFNGSGLLWTKGWGWADIEKGVAANAETIGRVGSISKTFTAVAMMQLVERGVIGLDDPVRDYLPEIDNLASPPAGSPPITFRMLASHTSGLQREPDLPGAASGPIYLWQEQILRSIPTTGFLTPPLTEYAYSNIGYGMLGLALERAAGVSFMELVETMIFEPLALESSFFILDTPDRYARMSVGYARNRQTGEISAQRATAEHFGRGYKVPNGGIYSTVGDLAKFGAALIGSSPVEILSEETRTAMHTPQAPSTGYGLGLQVSEREGVTVVGHGGSVAGYNAYLGIDPESGLGVAMLRTTSYNPPAQRLLSELALISR